MWRSSMAGALLGSMIVFAASAGLAQDEPVTPDSGVSEQVSVVVRQVDFLVVDKKGRPITDLRADEVRLWDGGEPQTILDFVPAHGRFVQPSSPPAAVPPAPDAKQPAEDTTHAPDVARPAAPRWIIFLFDARNLSYQGRARSAKAVQELIEEHLGPQDRVSLMIDEDELRVLVPFTTYHENVLSYIRSPDGLSSRYRDIEQRLEDLRDDAETCRDARDRAGCAEQAATNFVFETSRETDASLKHLEALMRSLASIPDRKILFLVSEGFLLNPGDVASAAVEHAIGQLGYNVNATRTFLMSDYTHRMNLINELAVESRTGVYAVNTMRKMVDDLFSVERPTEGGPEMLPAARSNAFEATWQQVRKLHTQMAQSTGAVALFRRDPAGLLQQQLDAAAGVYTVSYSPTDYSWDRRKIKIKVSRGKVRVRYRNRYSLNLGQHRRMGGRLTVSEPDPSGLVRAEVEIPGGDFELEPDSDPRASVASLFFELRDAENRRVKDLYETIAFPRGQETGLERLRRPFALKVPPGAYTLRVDVSDVNGPGRGSYFESFTVGAPADEASETADPSTGETAGGT